MSPARRRWAAVAVAAVALAAALAVIVARRRAASPGPAVVRAPTLVSFPPEEAWLDAAGRRLLARVPCEDDDRDDATAVFDPAAAAPALRCPRAACLPGCVVGAPPAERAGPPRYDPSGLTWAVELAPDLDDALAPAAVLPPGDEPAVAIRWAPARGLDPAWRAQAQRGTASRVVFTYRSPRGAVARFAVAPTITRGYAATLVTIVPLADGAIAWILSGNQRDDDDRQATAWLAMPP
ncbi:MAG: hypothetical protein JNK64_39195 [Myxococcales bacterium]|nr:hypothetical protein [Myxococcales bacterium]